MGEYRRALPLFERALAIREKALGAEHPDTVSSLNNLAEVHRSMGAFDRALPLYERSLAIREKVLGPKHRATAISLNNLALLYESTGAYERALPIYERSLAIYEQAMGAEHPETATSLDNLAELHRSMGAYQLALPLYRRAQAIREKVLGAEHPLTGLSMNHLAELYRSMGAHEQALPLYQRSLAINEKALGTGHDRTATALNNAEFYRATAAYERALPIYERSLAIRESALGADHPRTATSVNNLGELHRSMRAYDKALPLLQRALAIDERALGGGHPDTTRSLNNLALLHAAMGSPERALPLYQRSLAIALARMRSGSDPKLLGSVAGNLCGSIAAAGPTHKEEAIFHCKARRQRGAVPARRGTGSRSCAARVAHEKHRRRLPHARATAGRTRARCRSRAGPARVEGRGVRAAPVALTPNERRLLDEINALADALGKVYADLDAHRRQASELSPDELALRQDRRDLLQRQLIGKLGEVSARLAVQPSEVSSAIRPDDTRLARLTDKLVRSGYGESTVVVMYVPEERVTTVLVTSPAGPVALQLPLGWATLNPLVDRLRVAIREKASYRAEAQALHQHLVAPVETHLLAHKLQPKTLMLYLTDRLRYLPFATLVDGDGRHLVEKYRLAVFTAAARDKADAPPITRWSVTAFGSTRPGGGLSALPGVKDELDAIVRTKDNPQATLPGRRLIDEQFTRDAWQNMLNRDAPADARHSVVHVATRFQSQPGDWGKSFLLLGTGERYEISELSDSLSANLEDVDLITLSACATELGDAGDGKEFEGLGALLQKKGARAVIGTLWPVQDDGSAALMRAFYAARGERRQMSKAQALQDAQLQLLGGKLKSRNAAIDLRHPYYWAPFILMGNWL